MTTFKKKDLNELVGGDFSSGGGDRNVTNNSEIETGPVQKPYNDNSDYEKGIATTTDKVVGRYRQNIPWFAVYSYGGTRGSGIAKTVSENKTVLKKTAVEEKIEDIVKKSKDSEINPKDFNSKINSIVTKIKNSDLNDSEIEEIEKSLIDLKSVIKNNKEKTI